MPSQMFQMLSSTTYSCRHRSFILPLARFGVSVVFFIIWMSTGADSLLAADRTSCAGNTAAAAVGAADPDITPKLLPPPSNDNDPSIPTIKLGETIRFEQYGPIILNSDGTTRRIANWDQLTDAEKETTWRRISKRNEERRKILLAQQEQEQLQQESSSKDDGV